MPSVGLWLQRLLLVYDRQHVLFPHEENVAAGLVFLELVAGPSGENDRVAFLDLKRPTRSVLHHLARPDCQYFALLWFVLGIIGKNDSPGRLLIRFEPTNNDPISQWLYLHGKSSACESMKLGNNITLASAPSRCNSYAP